MPITTYRTPNPLTSWGLFIAQSHHLSKLFAAGALMLEVGFVIALFSRRSRWVLVPEVVAMQTGITALMGPNFYQMIMCQAMWVPWDRVVRWLAGRVDDLAESGQHHGIERAGQVAAIPEPQLPHTPKAPSTR